MLGIAARKGRIRAAIGRSTSTEAIANANGEGGQKTSHATLIWRILSSSPASSRPHKMAPAIGEVDRAGAGGDDEEVRPIEHIRGSRRPVAHQQKGAIRHSADAG